MRIDVKNNFLSVLFIVLGAVFGLLVYEVIGEPSSVRSITSNPVSCAVLMAFTGYLGAAGRGRKREE